MRNEDFLRIQRQQHDDVIAVMDANKTATNAAIIASADMVNVRLDRVVQEQKISNGRLYKIESQTAFVRWVGQHPKVAIPLLAVFGVGIFFLLQMFGIKIFL